MTEKFTPGPWVFNGSFIGTDEADTKIIAQTEEHRNRRMRSNEENLANAHLIAAAPDMYHKLTMIAEVMEEHYTDWIDGFDVADVLPLLNATRKLAREAIAKAEGRE